MSFIKTWCKKALRGSVATAAISSVLLLAACGDDSSSSGPSDSGISDSDLIAATFDDLPVCTDKRNGVTAYVKDKKVAYVCKNGDWKLDFDDDNDDLSSLSSSSQKAKSSSSNKDNAKLSSSVKASSDSKDSKSSSSIKASSSSALIKTVVKDKSVSGVSQKGPFVTGAAVKLYELDGKTYAQTGKNFIGKITTDDGKFDVTSVTLASQYALLEANGYFRNEITGKKSSGTITLNALTDLSDREKVNINLLTHLEYERALYLVSKGKDVLSAKKQAEAEILNALGIKGEFASSEDLDIFSKGDGNAALLAFSVLMLCDLSEADLTELLTKFAIDIEKDGRWDDEATKAKIADWAAAKDLAGELATIRSNIEKWNLGTVPEFEKYIRNFWYSNYGLGECGSNNKTEMLAVKNERSSIYGSLVRFICKNGAWIEATDIEKDFYQSGKVDGDDGELWTGLLTGKKYKYDDVQKKWLMATHNDTTLKLNGCTAKRTDEIRKSSTNETYYVCRNMDWQKAQEIDLDTYGEKCTSKEVGRTISGVITAANKYYCSADGWMSLMGGWSWNFPKEARFNSEIKYDSMTDSRDSRVYRTVKIGDQVWMAENLNYADSATTLSLKGNSWCYDNEPKNCAVAGRLYTWAAAIDSVKLASDLENPRDCGVDKICSLPDTVYGICPPGWHLPTKTEWETLFTEVGGQSTAGIVFKSQTGWFDDGNGTDAYGFSAVPACARSSNGAFRFEGSLVYFWSASISESSYAYCMQLFYNFENADLSGCNESYAFSIRCLKN